MLAVPSTKDLHILKHVLSIVALTAVILQRLAPDQCSVAGARDLHDDLLALMTLNHELGALE